MFKINNITKCQRLIKVFVRQKSSIAPGYAACNYYIMQQQNVFPQNRHFSVTTVLEKRLDKRKSSKQENDSDSDDDNDVEFKDERDSKVIRTSVNSLRADLLLKAGLGIARNKIENMFYESRIRVNGRKLAKKSIQLHNVDEIDIIRGFSQTNPSHLVVSRVIILSSEAREESISVHLRRYKSLLVENYKGADAFKSSTPVE